MSDALISRWESDEEIAFNERLYSSFLPAMFGGIIGDALGVPVEFKKRDSFLQVTDMIGYGTYNQKPGTWSDDTSLTLCLIENLIEGGDQESLMKKFVKYYKSGYWTPYNKVFDIGNATKQSIYLFINKTPAEDCGQKTEYDNGNGALMRIAPIAFVMGNCFDFPLLIRAVEQYAVITHAHPRSTLGCIIYAGFLFRLFQFDDFHGALDIIIELCERYLVNTKYESELVHYKRILDKSIKNLTREQIVSSGYVVHSLEAALWCCYQTDNFKDAVLLAVNLGGDTDTIASITGTLAGLFYKIESIPKKWLNSIARKKDIDKLLENFILHYSDIMIKYTNKGA